MARFTAIAEFVAIAIRALHHVDYLFDVLRRCVYFCLLSLLVLRSIFALVCIRETPINVSFLGRWRDSVVDSPNRLRFPVITFPDGSLEFRVAWGAAPQGRKRDILTLPTIMSSYANDSASSVRVLPLHVNLIHEHDETSVRNVRPIVERKRDVRQSTSTCLQDTLICPGIDSAPSSEHNKWKLV